MKIVPAAENGLAGVEIWLQNGVARQKMKNRCRLFAVVFMALGVAPLSGCAPVSGNQAVAMQQKMQNIDQEQGQPMESNGPLGYNTTVHR